MREIQHKWLKPLAIIALATLCVIIWLEWGSLCHTADTIFCGHCLGGVAFVCTIVFLAVNLAAFLWQVWLMFRYKPVPACTDSELPAISVIVPAYNEGQGVLEAIRSLLASDYPAEKLQIIAVDDGSTDDTWDWIVKASEGIGRNVVTIRSETNQGKRHALYEGFLRSTGSVLVTVDSDSIVDRQALRNLVSPLSRDEQVGAVAGNVRVKNLHHGPIPRMLDVSFLFSFDFQRAGQSQVNAVMCTPGALSAYRRDVVMKHIHEWRNQTFCGRPANHGEDRHLTNLILREGYHVVFQRNAVVYTDVPTGYRGLCKMFLRWGRSNVREILVMSSFFFRRFRNTPATGARIHLLLAWMSLTVSQIFFAVTLACLIILPKVFFVHTLIGLAISSSFPALLYALRTRSTGAIYAYVYSLYWFVLLSWITPYAILTAHHNGWLTRQTPALEPQPLTSEPRPLTSDPRPHYRTAVFVKDNARRAVG